MVRRVTSSKKPPQVIHVAYCIRTGVPQYADLKAHPSKRYSCMACDASENPDSSTCMRVARYQHAPGKKRSPRKPRAKRWKREARL